MKTTFTIRLSNKESASLQKKAKSLGISKVAVTRKLIRGEICLSDHKNGFNSLTNTQLAFNEADVDVERLARMQEITARSAIEVLALLQKFTDQTDKSLGDEARKNQLKYFKELFGE